MKTEADDDDDGAVRVGSFVPWILLKLSFTGILFFLAKAVPLIYVPKTLV